MRKLVFLLAVIAAFAFDRPGNPTCVAPVVPVCFNPAVSGQSYCLTHMPTAKPCDYFSPEGNFCLMPAKAGSIYCAAHAMVIPPLTDSTHQ